MSKLGATWRRRGSVGLRIGAALLVVGLLVSERSLITSSLRVVTRLNWVWLPVAVALESASMACFARMQRRLLTAGSARVARRSVLATAYAGNALSATMPLAGSQVGTVFAFRRFKQLGVDGTVAGMTLVVSGVVSSLTSALLLAVGAILTGNDVTAVIGAVAATVGFAIFALVVAAIHRPAARAALRRPAGRILRLVGRLRRRPIRDSEEAFDQFADRVRSFRLSPWGWAVVIAVGFLNWLADAGVLAASIVAVGSRVPWQGLLFAYGVGTAASSVGVTPGGVGVVEGAFAVALMASGVRHPLALAAVLVYRLVSFWLVIAVGWVVYLFRPRMHRGHLSSPDSLRQIPSGGVERPRSITAMDDSVSDDTATVSVSERLGGQLVEARAAR
jgi:putative heme transporter